MWGRKKSQIEVDADLLARADTVAFGGVGFAARVLPVTEAYRRLELAATGRGGEVRAAVDRLLERGSPAGRVYAATLLERIDPAAARAAWAGLTAEEGEFTRASGCLLGRTTVREHAADRLAAN